MPVTIPCPVCQARYKVPEALLEKLACCPRCHTAFKLRPGGNSRPRTPESGRAGAVPPSAPTPPAPVEPIDRNSLAPAPTSGPVPAGGMRVGVTCFCLLLVAGGAYLLRPVPGNEIHNEVPPPPLTPVKTDPVPVKKEPEALPFPPQSAHPGADSFDSLSLLGTWEPLTADAPQLEFTPENQVRVTGRLPDGGSFTLAGTWTMTGNLLRTTVRAEDREQTNAVRVKVLTERTLTLVDVRGKEDQYRRK